MKYEFKQAAKFGPHESFGKGVYEVPEKVTKHPFFEKLQNADLIIEHVPYVHSHAPKTPEADIEMEAAPVSKKNKK